MSNSATSGPSTEVEIRFQNEGFTFAGVLTIPGAAGPRPAVVMISGSGPNTRDNEVFGFNSFQIIADHLAKNGIAVLRYDGRGVGTSTGENGWDYTSEDFARDAAAAFQFLQGHPEIDPLRLGFIGHSEGGRIAPQAASLSKEVAFIVLMAGFAMTGEENTYIERKYWGMAEGETEQKIEEGLAWFSRFIQGVQTGEGLEEVRSDALYKGSKDYQNLEDEDRERYSDANDYLNSTLEGMFLPMAHTPWLKFFLDYDPEPYFREVACPVLALFGELDFIIPPREHIDRVVRAFSEGGNQDVTVEILPGANHYFAVATTGSWSEFRANEKNEFVPEFLSLMTSWILDRS